jgi:hypothetical protein
MYQQRKEPEDLDILGPWIPKVSDADDRPIEISPNPKDRYAVVDEIIGEDLRLAVTFWPQVDGAGRLHFDQGSEPFGFDRSALQAEVDRHREVERQLVRPLRIGDVFFIRGFGELGTWERVLDITGASRRAAKHAGLRAVAQPEVGASRTKARRSVTKQGKPRAPKWRRRPSSPPPEEELRPPSEPTPGSVANSAV